MRVVSMYFYTDRMQASLCIYLDYNSPIEMHSFYILYLLCNKLMTVKLVSTLKIEAVHLFETLLFIHMVRGVTSKKINFQSPLLNISFMHIFHSLVPGPEFDSPSWLWDLPRIVGVGNESVSADVH